MISIPELLIALLAPYLLYQIIRYLRRGKVIDGGTIEIFKNPNSDVFADKVKMNGKKIDCIFDTGASVTSIGINEAKKIGIDPSTLLFMTTANTAAGTIENALAEAEVEILEVGPITVKNIGIMVNKYQETECLLGMNFFSSLDSFEIKNDKLILKHMRGKGSDRSQDKPEQPVAPPSTSDLKIIAKCPDCDGQMALPPDKDGIVICRFCNKKFYANTFKVIDGYADTNKL